MTGFMIGRSFAIFFPDNLGFSLQTHINLVLGVIQIHHVHFFLISFCSQKRRLINKIFQISAGKTGSAFGQNHCIHIR